MWHRNVSANGDLRNEEEKRIVKYYYHVWPNVFDLRYNSPSYCRMWERDGLVVVHSSPDRAVLVRALAGTLCCVLRQDT